MFCCDGLVSHGGLVDRFKGIITTYEIAKQLGYDFKILFNEPFELDKYLKPNLLNWQFKKDQVKYVWSKTKILYLIDDFDVNPLEEIQKSNASVFYVYSNIDHLSLLYKDLKEIEVQKKWTENFRELFKYSTFLIDNLPKIEPKTYNVVHTRFTSIMGDFKDVKRPALSEEQKKALSAALLEETHIIAKKNNEDLYVLSDSIIFLNYIQAHTEYKILPGKPGHSDHKTKDGSLDGHTKTFTDFIFMANAKSVFLLQKQGMYNSAFSRYAAIIGGAEFKRIN